MLVKQFLVSNSAHEFCTMNVKNPSWSNNRLNVFLTGGRLKYLDIHSSKFMVIHTAECSYLQRLRCSALLYPPSAPVQAASSSSASKSSAAPRDNSSSQTPATTKSRPSTGTKAYPPPRKVPRPPPRSPFHMVSKLYLVIYIPSSTDLGKNILGLLLTYLRWFSSSRVWTAVESVATYTKQVFLLYND